MRRKAPLELMHIDVCYMDTKSHARLHYSLNFIDDYSRKLWVSMLKTKDWVLSFFKEFQAKGERETSRTLKAVQAGNGGEYRW